MIIKSLSGAIAAKTVTYDDLARLVEEAIPVSCSGFENTAIEQ